MNEAQSIQYQIDEWLAGRPWHNHMRGECCPDFSCCGGKIAELNVRQRFIKAIEENDNKTRSSMLGMFLGSMFEQKYGVAKSIHIVEKEKPGAIN